MEGGPSRQSNNKKRRAEENPEGDNDKGDKMPKTGHSPPRSRRNSLNGDPVLTESTLKAMMDGMENRMLALVASMGADLKKNEAETKEVRKLLVDTESNLVDRMDGQKRELEAMIRNMAVPTASAGPGRLTPKNEETYWHYRKSLSIWPVPGDDASAGIRLFLIQKLRFTEEQVRDLGRVLVKRLREPTAKARREVFCTFETKETRDLVKASSKHLAGDREAGLRPQFPGFLVDTFRIFESIGYHLRSADPDIRRSVKYDDAAMDLVMDVKIGDEWKRIRPSEAKKTLEDNPQIRRGPTELTSQSISDILKKSSGRTPATGANATPRQ